MTNELLKQTSIPLTGGGGGGGSEQEKEINGLSLGEWVTLNGKVVALTRPRRRRSPRRYLCRCHGCDTVRGLGEKANATPMEMGRCVPDRVRGG